MPEGFTLTPILISLGALIAGWAIGFFDSNNRSAKKIKEAEARAEHVQKEAQRMIAQAEQKLALNADVPQDDPGLLRIKTENGRAVVEMDGLPVNGALSSDKRKRLIDLITILRPYLEGGQPQQPAQTPSVSVSAQRPISHPTPPAPVKPVEPSLGAILSPAKKTSVERPMASLSIVGQIDMILQARLINTALAGRGIRLQESLQGAVEVYVGLQKFPGVDDVPDESIKAAIRAAIAEWEEKYTPR